MNTYVLQIKITNKRYRAKVIAKSKKAAKQAIIKAIEFLSVKKIK